MACYAKQNTMYHAMLLSQSWPKTPTFSLHGQFSFIKVRGFICLLRNSSDDTQHGFLMPFSGGAVE